MSAPGGQTDVLLADDDFRVWTRNGHRWEFRLRTLGPRQPGNKPANGLRLPSLSLARGNLSIAQCRNRGAG